MTPPPSAEMIALADKIYEWEGKRRMGASKVATWWRKGVPCFAFIGKSLTLETHLFKHRMWSNRGYRTDLGMQNALGIEARLLSEGGYYSRPYGIESPVGQLLDEPDVDVATVLEGLETACAHVLGVDRVDIFVIAEEGGAPWNVGDKSTPYYLRGKGRTMQEGRAPAGVISVVTDEGKAWGVDPCKYAEKIEVDGGEMLGVVDGAEILVTHSMDMDLADTTGSMRGVKGMARCGGLLYPSLAVGHIPASTFGPLTLCASFRYVKMALREYYRRHSKPWKVVLYKTDAWTATMGDILKTGAMALFAQLTGYFQVSIYTDKLRQHMWTLGPPVEETGFMDKRVPVVKTRDILSHAIEVRMRKWGPTITRERMDKLSQMTRDRYPYLEAKVHGIIPFGPDSLPLAVCARQLEAKATAYLSRAGFHGHLVTFEAPDGTVKAMTERNDDMATYQYSWMVRRAIMQWCEQEGSVLDLGVGSY